MESRERKATELVYNSFTDYISSGENLKLVWFCKTLQNWKAIIADVSEEGSLFEVSYNGDKKETYIDMYEKFKNVKVPD